MRNILVALSLLLLSACAGAGMDGLFGESAPPAAPPAQAAAPPVPVTLPPPPTAAVKVALILPLSGTDAAFGKSLQHAAELAVMDIGHGAFELMPRDSRATPSVARDAARDVLARGAQIIVGPLYSGSVAAVKPLAAAAGAPVLALSNDATVAGGGAWLMGFSPVEQVRRVASHAAARGIRNIAVLAPSTLYGDLALAALKQSDAGMNVVALARYRDSDAAIAAAVASIAGNRRGAQALFLPEGGALLRKIAARLARHGMAAGRMQLIGTGLWDDKDVAADRNLWGGWYAAPDPAPRAGFARRYAKNFGARPPRLASLVYDAVSLAAALAGKGVAPPYTEAALTRPDGFAGVDGVFRLTSRGVAERALAVMEISRGRARIISPAPKRF